MAGDDPVIDGDRDDAERAERQDRFFLQEREDRSHVASFFSRPIHPMAQNAPVNRKTCQSPSIASAVSSGAAPTALAQWNGRARPVWASQAYVPRIHTSAA